MALYDEEAHGRSTLSASPLCEPVGDAVVGMASLLRSCLNCVRPSSTVDSHIENKDFMMNTRTSFSSTSTSFSYFHFLLQNSSFSYFRIFNVNEDHPSTSSDMRVARVTEANSHAESEDAIDVVTHVHGTQTRFRSASGSDIEFGFGEDRRGNSDTDTEADSPVQIPWLRPYNLIMATEYGECEYDIKGSITLDRFLEPGDDHVLGNEKTEGHGVLGVGDAGAASIVMAGCSDHQNKDPAMLLEFAIEFAPAALSSCETTQRWHSKCLQGVFS